MLQACPRGDRSQEFEVPMVASEINDALLFQTHLPPGTRSARFERTGRLPERYRLSGHGIHFFYFNTGHQNQIARIEIPQWVGEDGEAMKALHAILLEQCSGLGYPYVLIRAHECAVVSQGDRASLEAMIQGSFLAQGMQPHPSRKAQAKRWVRKKW